MPASTIKKRNMRQLVASLLVDADVPEGKAVYVVKTPRADLKHNSDPSCACYGCQPQRQGALRMYGLEFTDGVALTDDKELAEKITAEFPEYHFEELK